MTWNAGWRRQKKPGLVGVAAIGTNAADSVACVRLAEAHPQIVASVGIHPTGAHLATSEDWNQIVDLVEHPGVVAIGETGLDQYWKDCPFEIQQESFSRHIELMLKTGKPLVIHTRDCEQEMLEALRRYASRGELCGIMHSFCGSWEAARQFLEWGLHISFAGMVTFKKSEALRDVARKVPLDRLLVETDAPYLTPHPIRGKRPNHPANVRHTAQCLAEAMGVGFDQLARATTQNAKRLFGLDDAT